jgi:hypothetical protein
MPNPAMTDCLMVSFDPISTLRNACPPPMRSRYLSIRLRMPDPSSRKMRCRNQPVRMRGQRRAPHDRHIHLTGVQIADDLIAVAHPQRHLDGHAGSRAAVFVTKMRGTPDSEQPRLHAEFVRRHDGFVSLTHPYPGVVEAVQRLGLPADAALALEDSRNGLISPRAAGLPVVVTPSLYTGDEDFKGADWLLPDLSGFDLAAFQP